MAAQSVPSTNQQTGCILSLGGDVQILCDETTERVSAFTGTLITIMKNSVDQLNELVNLTDGEKKNHSKGSKITQINYENLGDRWAYQIDYHRQISAIYFNILGTFNKDSAGILNLTGSFNELRRVYNHALQHSLRGLRDNFKAQNDNAGTLREMLDKCGRYLSSDGDIEATTLQEFGSDRTSEDLFNQNKKEDPIILNRDGEEITENLMQEFGSDRTSEHLFDHLHEKPSSFESSTSPRVDDSSDV